MKVRWRLRFRRIVNGLGDLWKKLGFFWHTHTHSLRRTTTERAIKRQRAENGRRCEDISRAKCVNTNRLGVIRP